MALDRGKTPITCLHEICTKRGILPAYELMTDEEHAPSGSFMFRVTAGDCSAEGRGSSKKKAKHNAAAHLLVQLLPASADTTDEAGSFGSSSSHPLLDESLSTSDVNFVGQLQELSQQQLWPLPVYEFTEDTDGAHERIFKCKAQLLSLVETGLGRSKKKAKQNAAENLLQLIKNSVDVKSLSSQKNLTNGNCTDSQTYDKLCKMVSSVSLDRTIQTLTATDSLEIGQFYKGLKYRTGKTLASLQLLALNMPATNYCQMLQEIAEEQDFVVVYVDIPSFTVCGLFQCLVQLSCKPVAVCQGVGQSPDEARSNAAHNALQYLKIMTRK